MGIECAREVWQLVDEREAVSCGLHDYLHFVSGALISSLFLTNHEIFPQEKKAKCKNHQ